MGRFDGKVALVTGAASGVGRATALRMADEGATVYGVDINADGLADAAAATTGTMLTAVHDVSGRDAAHEAVAGAVERFGALDILANVAGVVRIHHMVDVTEEVWRKIIGVNLDAVFWLSQAAVPHLLKRDGVIVNVASNAGLMGQAYTVPYCSAKAAVVNLTRSMAMEFARTGLRVNAVAPGGMLTSMTETIDLPADVDAKLMDNYRGWRGLAGPETAAAAICWLASDEAVRCHGSILSVDGGLAAG